MRHGNRMPRNKLPGMKRKVHTKELNELVKTTDKTYGCVRPERVKK